MFKILIVFVCMLVVCSVNGGKTPLGAAKKVVAQKIEQKTCPVMGGEINPALFYKYKKEKIYVCCPGCIDIIKKNPEKYLKKVKAEIAAAKKKSGSKTGK